MLELNIQDLRKKALIKFSVKPEGHVYGVHRLTNAAEMSLSEISRRANKLILRMEVMQGDKQINEKEIRKIVDEIEGLEEEKLKVKASVFDDGGDGSLSLALIKELTENEVGRLVRAVENDESIVPDEKKSDAKTA